MTDDLTTIDDLPGEAQDDPTFRSFVTATLADLESGAMWAAWTPDGRPAYGETDDPVPDGAEVVTDPISLAAMAGIIVTHVIAETTAAQPEPAPFVPTNREQRRARARAGRKKGR